MPQSQSQSERQTTKNEATVEAGFWPKIRKVAARLPFAETLVAAYFCTRDPATPTKVRAMLIAALAYFVTPVDLLPDFIAYLGFTDDAAVIATIVSMVGSHIRPRHHAEARKALGLPPKADPNGSDS